MSYHCYQLLTNFYQNCSVQCNSVCSENYWEFSVWMWKYRSRRITYCVLVRLWGEIVRWEGSALFKKSYVSFSAVILSNFLISLENQLNYYDW
jgi:hypothetical protein